MYSAAVRVKGLWIENTLTIMDWLLMGGPSMVPYGIGQGIILVGRHLEKGALCGNPLV
jgi:hypothetical protein